MSILHLTHKSKNICFTRMSLSNGEVGVKRYASFNDSYSIVFKNEQPRFKGRLGDNLWMVFADFDALPDSFVDWDGFGSYLETFNTGCVIDTMSGKKKVVLYVFSDAMTSGIAYNTIKKYFGELADSCDRSAFCHSYIHPTQFSKLNEYLETSEPIQAVRDVPEWSMIKIPEFKGISGITRKVLQFFSSCNLDTVDGSQKYMAELFDVSQSAVCQAVKKLITMGFIELVDSSYRVGVKAKTYRVVNSVCIRSRDISKVMKSVYTMKLSELPRDIEPGQWFSTVWASTRFFNNPSQFISWVKSLSGYSLKGRFKRCMQAWNAHATKNNLALAVIS